MTYIFRYKVMIFIGHIPAAPRCLGSGTTWRSCSGSSPPTSSRCCSSSRRSPPEQRRLPRDICSNQRWARDQTLPDPGTVLTRGRAMAAWDLAHPSWCPRWGGPRRRWARWAWWCRTCPRAERHRADQSRREEDRTAMRHLRSSDLQSMMMSTTYMRILMILPMRYVMMRTPMAMV